ncbi:DUF86 domain-containing protein [Thermosynechococcus vestitus]|uniref:Tll2231 protein n=1 Tax=Thermosynechococcus vestitus (strain NIES-2133 / IAM M-273 / BP-1) TaxID=197221 RepID=Q8DGT2_THEVB|nr:DUF86 domain-containing protein [Thermosynechococcus vestitus]BAC09783.1 tll2231 [Thermosynechococcus vestitus BP-1]
MRDPKERLQDILTAIEAIERYVPRGKVSFEGDELLQAWFVRNLEIIGEAARALPDSIRALAPDIPWHKIIGMRNILVHGYFEIDTEIVWEAATRDLPLLKQAVKRLITKLEEQSHGG